jgi:hypothetical protein
MIRIIRMIVPMLIDASPSADNDKSGYALKFPLQRLPAAGLGSPLKDDSESQPMKPNGRRAPIALGSKDQASGG